MGTQSEGGIDRKETDGNRTKQQKGRTGTNGAYSNRDRLSMDPNRRCAEVAAVWVNDRLIDKASRRREELERWNGPSSAGMRQSGVEKGTQCIRGACDARGFPSPHEEVDFEALYAGGWFVDDVKGGILDRGKVIEARRLEMDFFKRLGVYRKLPRDQVPRGRIITTKWVDTNKGSALEPEYRSRLVGREIKTDARPDLFAATPPLESLRYVASLCASSQSRRNPHRILTIDVKRAYFYAPVRRPIFIELPAEDRLEGEGDLVAQLNLSVYGTRDAAKNWTCEYTRALSELGFTAGRASPCIFWNKERDLHLTVHGDDFTVSGPEKQLEWLARNLKTGGR